AYFPAAIWLGKIHGTELIRALVIEAVWVVVMAVACRIAWRRGTRRYSAFGG
ncbi:MAG: ABC transporter permease, partial [Planctomycetaceae bacterium]